ncbi:hypothetical protein K7T73_13070 [Bacillus badius]|uniref:hypothetical protein n=1 Tax=Bacillus badius TaxID=1455 RepID=UPI001CBF10C5|nr:hypothetical protein [Bacillus badius]UAT29531.1 hypothetical protein K7T73_13070 [Bacillus badius]
MFSFFHKWAIANIAGALYLVLAFGLLQDWALMAASAVKAIGWAVLASETQ